jgi:hypothetical protein
MLMRSFYRYAYAAKLFHAILMLVYSHVVQKLLAHGAMSRDIQTLQQLTRTLSGILGTAVVNVFFEEAVYAVKLSY